MTIKIAKLIHGDCLEKMLELPENSVDMILADPPYGVTASKWDSVLDFGKIWSCLNHIRKDHAPILLFGNEPFSSYLRTSNIKEFKYDWIWIKNQATNHLHAKRMPMRKTENISVFFKKASWYHPQKTTGHIPTNNATGCSNGVVYHGTNKRNYKGGDTTRMPKNIQYFDCVDNYHKIHPNEKPIPLLQYLIKTYTNENDTVLDFCFGSCSTGVACKKTNRNFIGIEKDEQYFNIGTERLQNDN